MTIIMSSIKKMARKDRSSAIQLNSIIIHSTDLAKRQRINVDRTFIPPLKISI